jgi:N-acetylneuraminic acid mutarotase
VGPLGTAFFNRELVNRNNGWVATPRFTNPERSQNLLQIWVVDAATDSPNLTSTLNQGALAAPSLSAPSELQVPTLGNGSWSIGHALKRAMQHGISFKKRSSG